MASYTMQLREYIESFSQDTIDNMKWSDVIEAGRTKLFDFDYPIFDNSYKQDFETHFIRNFYMREIGFETEGLFKFQLETWMLINMPYWNKMYESELLSYDPLTNSKFDVTNDKTNDKKQTDTNDSTFTGQNDITTTSTESQTDASNFTGKNDVTTTATNSETSNSTLTDDNFERGLDSNNPDSRLTLTSNDGEGVIEYASSIKEINQNNTSNKTGSVDNNGSGTNSGTSSGSENKSINTNGSGTNSGTTSGSGNNTLSSDVNETENSSQHTEGKIGDKTFARMIQEHRDVFLRIDKMIFKEMNELFMLVY